MSKLILNQFLSWLTSTSSSTEWAAVGGASLGQSHRAFTGNLTEVSSQYNSPEE